MPFTDPTTTLPGSAVTGPIDGNQLIAGSVHATALSADSIDGKTITGAVIRTAANEPRIILDSSTNTLTAADGATSWLGIGTNSMTLGGYNGNTGLKWTGGAGKITADINALTISGSCDTTEGNPNYGPAIKLDSGIFGGFYPVVRITSQAGGSADLTLTGNVYRTGATWQTPSYASGWAGGDTAGSFQPLQFRFDAEDNLLIRGAMHTTSATPATFPFVLPTAYRPATNNRAPAVSVSGSTVTAGYLEVGLNGSTGFFNKPTAASVDVYINAVIPLGHLL